MSTFFVGILFFAVLGAIIQGLRRIPADPPKLGIVTRLGKPINRVKNSGWGVYLGHPFLYGFIPVPAGKISKTLTLTINTPDSVPLATEVNLVFKFDKNNPVSFLESGGENGVWEILSNAIHERMREWSTSRIEGPQNWKEAREARGEVVAILLKAILGDDLPSVHGSIPTAPLLKYFSEPRKRPYGSEAKKWGANWEKLEAELNSLSAAEQDDIKSRVLERMKRIQEIRGGSEGLPKKNLGIRILRLSLGDIRPPKSIEEAAAKLPAAELEKGAERVRNETERENLKNLEKEVEALKPHLGGDGKAALDAVLLQRGKIKREINEHRLSIDKDTIKSVGGALAVALGVAFGGNRGQANNG